MARSPLTQAALHGCSPHGIHRPSQPLIGVCCTHSPCAMERPGAWEDGGDCGRGDPSSHAAIATSSSGATCTAWPPRDDFLHRVRVGPW